MAGSSHGEGTIELRFCTLADNKAGGGALRAHQRLLVRNSIVVGDGDGVGMQLDEGRAEVDHSAVHHFAEPFGRNTKPGDGVITKPPKFRDAANGDYRPEMDGPVVNAATDIGVAVDLDGNNRPYNAKDLGIDLGCHEVAPVPRDTVLLLR